MRIALKLLTSLVGFTVFVLVSGCSYAQQEERASIENVAVRPETTQFSVAVSYEKFRPATGINAFPNGGIPQYLEKTAIVYLVDVSTDEIVEIARIEAPEELQTSFNIHLMGWKRNRLYAQLSGCPGSECYGDLIQYRYYELGAGVEPRRIVDKPEDIERVPGMLSRSPEEVTYMRVSAGSQVISIRTNDSEPFIDQFMLKNNGELVEIVPSQ